MDSIVIYKKVTNIFIYTRVCVKKIGVHVRLKSYIGLPLPTRKDYEEKNQELKER